jgi:hypothetical protein
MYLYIYMYLDSDRLVLPSLGARSRPHVELVSAVLGSSWGSRSGFVRGAGFGRASSRSVWAFPVQVTAASV